MSDATLPAEEWRSIGGYEGLYEVSSLGRIRRLPGVVSRMSRHGTMGTQRVRGGLRVICYSPDRYPEVTLVKDGRHKRVAVHQAVARAFIGPCPEGQQVCHNDGITEHCDLGNLRYDTPLGNHQDKRKHGTIARGSRSGRAKLSEEQAADVLAAKGTAYGKDVAARFGISATAVSRIWAGRNWQHLTRESA